MVGIKYIAYAAVAASTAAAAPVLDDWVLDLIKRQEPEPGTPRYQCHEDCGTAITLSRGPDPCHDAAFNGRYSACLLCAGPANFDIWQFYGRTLTIAGQKCGLSTTPAGPSQPQPSPTPSPTTTTTPAAVSTTTPITTTSEAVVNPPVGPQSTTTPVVIVGSTTSESVDVPGGASTTTSASGQQAPVTYGGSASASASTYATPTSGGYVVPGVSSSSSSRISTSHVAGGAPTASGNSTSVLPSTTPQFTGAASAHFISMGAFGAAILAFLA